MSVIVPAGNTGEFSSLTTDEIAVLADRAVAEIGSNAAVVVGIGGDNRTATELAVRAAQAGADGIMIHERWPRIGDRALLRVARELSKHRIHPPAGELEVDMA